MSRKNPAAVALGRKGGKATSDAKAAAAKVNGAKGGRPTAHCIYCGWLVPAEGVSIAPEYDTPRDGARPKRCSDTACESNRECDELGRVVTGTTAASKPPAPR